jgi:hypothetical protein
MKKRLLFVLSVVFLFSCAAGIQYYTFAEPSSADRMLIVGRVIVEDNDYTGRLDVVKSGIEVAILGQPQDSAHVTGLWTITDSDGYFALANVPKGDYALKGIRVTLSNGIRVTLSNPLIKDRSFFRFNPPNTENIVFEGDHFPLRSVGRVISLQHNLFRLNPKVSMFSLENDTKQILKDVKLVNGSVANDPAVEDYFIAKHDDTVWRADLRASSKFRQQYQ